MDDFTEGYTDGRDLDNPEAGENRSDAYKHSFAIGRREAWNQPPIPAAISRFRAKQIVAETHSSQGG